jgi:uncharacterized glyoxalase superfamily protein PhnB
MSQSFYPLLRYRDARAALRWFKDVFGAEEVLVVPGPGDSIVHAQIRLHGAIIMLASVRDSDPSVRSPAEAGFVTSINVMAVDDVDAYYQRLQRLGAKITAPLASADGGQRRGFNVEDLEGQIWRFDVYRP